MKILIFILTMILIPSCGYAAFFSSSSIDADTIAAFRNSFIIEPLPITVPTVAEVPLPEEEIDRWNFLVIERETERFVPSLFLESVPVSDVAIQGTSEGKDISSLLDHDPNTTVRFELSPTGDGNASIMLTSDMSITTNGLSILLGENVALPSSVAVTVLNDDGSKRIVRAKAPTNSERIAFPPTSGKVWLVEFMYTQPFVLSEIELIPKTEVKPARTIRFLAQPGMSYTVFGNPDRSVLIPYRESGDLSAAGTVSQLSAPTWSMSDTFIPSDTDKDGVPDMFDNCVTYANTNQADADKNGRGDACDDFDKDGVLNGDDNCPQYPNAYQADLDHDGVGDVCDTEESRLTERYAWLPWLGIGIGIIAILTLFAVTARRQTKNDGDVNLN